MPTHKYACVFCGEPAYCSSDEHVLGLGGCYSNEPKIEFCSLACFVALRDGLAERQKIAEEMYPDWFRAVEASGQG